MHVQGDVDELNSMLGLLLSKLIDDDEIALVQSIQHDLFDIGAEISLSHSLIKNERLAWLEEHIDTINHELPELREFILPGGGEAASLSHLARSICRRAERNLVTLTRQVDRFHVPLTYLNRLSDFLFVFARYLTKQMGDHEQYWQSENSRA